MSRKLVAALLVVVIGIPALYFGTTILFISSGSDAMAETGQNANLQSCKSIKQSQCVGGSISESDYPESCFQDGEHLLDNPYQCN